MADGSPPSLGFTEIRRKKPKWTLWTHSGEFTNAQDWLKGLKKATKRSFDKFDEFESMCPSVGDLQEGQGFFVFKRWIKSEWENKNNVNGGHWETQFRGNWNSVDQRWRGLVKALVGGHFGAELTDEMICGVAVWRPRSERTIAKGGASNHPFPHYRTLINIDLWTRYSSPDHDEENLAIGAQMKNVLSYNKQNLYYAHEDFKGKKRGHGDGVDPRLPKQWNKKRAARVQDV